MQHAQLTDEVRRLVARTFADLGISDPDQVEESILIRDGNYCGRRFEAEFAVAVWFVEENEIKFYRADGNVTRIPGPTLAEPVATRIAA